MEVGVVAGSRANNFNIAFNNFLGIEEISYLVKADNDIIGPNTQKTEKKPKKKN